MSRIDLKSEILNQSLHKSVMIKEVIESFQTLTSKSELTYFDGTFGRGGHYQVLSSNFKISQAFATDQDLEAILFCKENFPEVQIYNQSYLDFFQQNPNSRFDMIFCDLGISSPQVDQADRGFSFNKDGPLDMRMNKNQNMTAARIINDFQEEDLYKVFREYGEIPNPARVVRAILNDRKSKAFSSTLELSKLIERVDGWQKKGFHPATQYFMGLRLVVNQELEILKEALPLLIQGLNQDGVISILTFHSLEDRIVKNLFQHLEQQQLGYSLNKKVIVPSSEECQNNPRARSAKLRSFKKGLKPTKPDKFALRRMQRV